MLLGIEFWLDTSSSSSFCRASWYSLSAYLLSTKKEYRHKRKRNWHNNAVNNMKSNEKESNKNVMKNLSHKMTVKIISMSKLDRWSWWERIYMPSYRGSSRAEFIGSKIILMHLFRFNPLPNHLRKTSFCNYNLKKTNRYQNLNKAI